MSDQDGRTTRLLGRWQAGDEAALQELLAEHLDWLRETVHARLGAGLRRQAETGDYVQEALIEFLRYGPRVTIDDGAALRALLARIVENVLRGNHRRWSARRRDIARVSMAAAEPGLDLAMGPTVDSPSGIADRAQRTGWIRLGMELLDDDARELLWRRNWQQDSYAAIAAELGISEDSVRKRHQRAVAALAEVVAQLRRAPDGARRGDA
ncbi:MAG: sigma-70 family RNA polymerase sigma factor [Planctomycetes bacterium]|nr:sigma-70 family RNA polymerase sigma factor [Planctomycetota bacterium]